MSRIIHEDDSVKETETPALFYSTSNPIPQDEVISILNALCDHFLDNETIVVIKNDAKFRGAVEAVAVKTIQLCKTKAESIISKELSLGEVCIALVYGVYLHTCIYNVQTYYAIILGSHPSKA